VDATGLYVPGGRGGETPLLSSLLMNAVPAQVAGVPRIVVVSPPRADGTLNPYILAAASVLGLSEIYRIGSAWAIAALAYGTATIAPVDVVVGPGNIYVTTAKRLLIGTIGIDMIAGPSEIAILADSSANPDWLAADMLSQAEHDPMAAAICVSPDAALLDAVSTALTRRLADLPRVDIAAASLKHFGALVRVPDLETGLDCINTMARSTSNCPWPIPGPWSDGCAMPGPCSWATTARNRWATISPAQPRAADHGYGPVLFGPVRVHLHQENEPDRHGSGYVAAHGAKIARLARLEHLEAHARSVECRLKGNG
jgi:histidinol dehydrogenase